RTSRSRPTRARTRAPGHAGPGARRPPPRAPGPAPEAARARRRRPLREPRRGVPDLAHLAGAGVHVHAARQARVEAADRTHDVDALEVLRTVLLEDRRVLNRVLVGARGAIRVTRAGVPWRRRVRLVVGDLALADHHVVREHAASGLVEPAG